MLIVRQLITRALRLIGQLGPGRGANASETADALLIFNSMIEAWNIERARIPYLSTTTWAATGAISYTIGPGADFDQSRPVRIDRVFWVDGENRQQYQPLVESQWIEGKTPGFYYDYGYPVGRLYFLPSYSAGQLELHVWSELAGFINVDQIVDFPPGYSDALAYQLAIRLAAEWGRILRPDVVDMAHRTLSAIESINTISPTMSADEAVLNRYGSGYDVSSNTYH